jgi:Fe-S cluster assembly protein SufD
MTGWQRINQPAHNSQKDDMITRDKEMINFIKDVQNIQQINEKNEPAWLTETRQKGLDRFFKLGIPKTSDEEWKYTNLNPITQKQFSFSASTSLKEKNPFERYTEKNETRLVFVNGNFSSELSRVKTLPKGILVTTLKDAMNKEEKGLKERFAQYAITQENAFGALNHALWKDGAYIKIDDNIICEELIHIIHLTSVETDQLLTISRTLISAGKSSQATILESHIALNDEQIYLSIPQTDIFLNENATLYYTKAQKESLKAFHIGKTRIWQERNANGNYFSLSAGSAISRNNLDVILNAEGTNAVLNGLYSSFDNQLVDNHTFVDHRAPNCTSNQLYKGVLNNSSHAVFNGKIYVHSIAQKTNSYQLNKNLILGKESRIDTKPQLEIFADDVKCTHGATIGQLNEDEIFYLQTRCIPRREAIRMLAQGFMEDIISTVKHPQIQNKMHQMLEPSFAHL